MASLIAPLVLIGILLLVILLIFEHNIPNIFSDGSQSRKPFPERHSAAPCAKSRSISASCCGSFS